MDCHEFSLYSSLIFRGDVIRMTDHRGTDAQIASDEASQSDSEPMDEALNYLLRQLRDSQQRKAA